VSQCVSEIRAALGDSAAEQRVIRTVPKRGYALVAPVRSSGMEGLSGGSRAPVRSARSAVRWLAAAAMALAVVGLAVWWGRSGAPESAARRGPTIVMPSFARVDPSDEETRWLSTGLAHLLASEISSLSRAKVISAHGLLESNARMEGPPGESVVVKLRAASIDYLIVGSYLVEGGGPDVRIDVAIFDPERNEAVAVFTEVAEIAHLSAGVGRLAARMIEALGIEGSPPTSRAALD
jgi:TolB-like protein